MAGTSQCSTFRRHTPPGQNGLFKGCRVFSSRSDIAEIVVHKADQPNVVVHVFNTRSRITGSPTMSSMSRLAATCSASDTSFSLTHLPELNTSKAVMPCPRGECLLA